LKTKDMMLHKTLKPLVSHSGFLLLIGYGAAAVFAYYDRSYLIAWLRNGDLTQLPILFGIVLFIAFVPVIPYGIIGGIMGAKFGLLIGGFISWFASFFAAVIIFLLARYAFARKGRALINRYHRLAQFTKMVEKNGFLAVLFSRLIPVIPALVVNVYAGLSEMSFFAYLFATALGKVPIMIVYAIVGKGLVNATHRSLLVVAVYALFLLCVYLMYYRWYFKRVERR
jgi:uncharacterized membrane protein YdjX (TVP38/TMEM64 family)